MPTVTERSRPHSAPRVERLLGNMLANFGGQAWSVVLSLVAIPVYIRLLGIESFGLIGICLTAQGLVRILDLGLTPAVNRQFARYGAHPEKAAELGDFARTFEVIFGLAGLAVTGLALAAAPLAARYWLTARSLDGSTIQTCLLLVAVLCGLQWPIRFYQGALMGLERQVIYNSLKAVEAAVGYGGAIAILTLVSPRIEALFLWQIFVGLLFLVALRVAFRGRLPRGDRPPRFRFSLFRSVWRFAAGMAGISITALMLTHVDKLLLSKLVTLEQFGYYTLVIHVSGGVAALMVTPVFNALFPRFSSLVATGQTDALRELYHLANQIVAVTVIPATLTIAVFSETLLRVWTGNVDATRNAAPILSVFILGTCLNGLMNPPYALQLSSGWTRLGVSINLFLVALFVPAVLVFVPAHGPMACATIWTALMAVYLGLGLPLTHRRILRGEALRCWSRDFAPATIASLTVLAASSCITPPVSRLGQLVMLAAVGLATLAVSAAATPRVRRLIVGALARMGSRGSTAAETDVTGGGD